MKDPRLVEIEFLSALERERPTSLTVWDWSKLLGVSNELFTDMVFGLFRDGCLEGTSTITPPQSVQTYDNNLVNPPEKWGQFEIERSVRTLLSGANSFAAHLNHSGRLRLWRLQDEVARARIKDAFGLLWDTRHWDTDLVVRLAMKDPDTTAVVLFIDIDNFKDVNTHAGYLVGNEVLRIVFQTVLTRVAGLGEAYRWGGDEITALLPNATREVGKHIGEAIRADVERECAVHPALRVAHLTTTVSVGVGAFTGRPSPASITTAASELMKKKVKEAGKNRVVDEVLSF